jgi:NurA-like 5'-3' nuclease
MGGVSIVPKEIFSIYSITPDGYPVHVLTDARITVKFTVRDRSGIVKAVAHYYGEPHEHDGCPLCDPKESRQEQEPRQEKERW